MRKRFIFLLMILFVMISACSDDDEVTPDERFHAYIEQWNDQAFEKMYDMLASESIDKYPTEQFVDRYNKIYEDIDISNLKVTAENLSEEDLEEAMKEGSAELPFTVKMDSLAGPITFDYEATLIQEGEEEKRNWFILWDPGFIFPEMKDGGEITFQTNMPVRGEILDRNQMPLAINDNVYEVGIVPQELEEDPKQQKEKIASLLNISIDTIDDELSAGWVEPDLFVPIKKIPKSKVDILSQLNEIDAISTREVTGRVYPLSKAAAHLIGYIGKITAEELEKKDPAIYGANDLIGKRGMEQLFDEKLKGEKGIKIVVSTESEDNILAEKPVKDGENVIVTIDVTVQEKVFEAYNDEAGTATAIDPKTGETLALVSSPAFDPNELLYGISQKQWETLQDDPQAPLLNRFTATYAPGSVIKPISAAIGLQDGSIIPDEGIDIKGLTWSNGKGWGDYKVRRVSETNQPVDLADALIRSDNIYFAMKAVEMGSEDFVNGLKQFGFEKKIPFEYPFANSTISSSGTLNGEVPLANTSYGQAEIEVSTLHLASAYTTFLNDGNMIKPILLESEDTEQVWQKNLITADQAEVIQQSLRDVVQKGTATIAKSDKLTISGKTGTAELKQSSDEKGNENGWFVGYPTEEKNILIAMMIEHTEDIGTSTFVAEKVKDILLDLN